MAKQMQTRTEKDSLGQVKVPKNAYYGAFTVRADQNFQISGLSAHIVFQKALATVKLAAAQTNGKLKVINSKQQKAIVQACQEFIDGKYSDQFTLDVFQAGAGTSYNMNCNEILANRADEILGGTKGQYQHIHPNNHVNQAQSTNDVIPTATRLATLDSLPELYKEIEKLEKTLEKIAKQESKTLKVGRTHLQDAVPITLGQEFDSYKQAITKSHKFIKQQANELLILGIGGTAVGTGINTDPDYKKLMVQNLSKITGHKFKSGKNLTEMANNMNSFMNLSSSLKSLANNLLNLSHDLKLMNTGPKAGLQEIILPPVQPGSSIMPGKINPSIPECLDMICFQVSGNDKVIELSASRSHFDLNVYCPIIMHNLLQSIQILTNGIKMLRELALQDLKVNHKHIKETFDNSLCTGTALAPYIGYLETSDVIKTALKKGTTIKEEVLHRKLLSPKKLEEILSVKSTTQPKRIR